MSLGLTILFVLFAAVLLGIVVALWRYWRSFARIGPDEEAYDQRVAALNERQANRLSDDQLRQPLTDEDAWNIMLRRGMQARKRDRYAAELRRKLREGRRRMDDR